MNNLGFKGFFGTFFLRGVIQVLSGALKMAFFRSFLAHFPAAKTATVSWVEKGSFLAFQNGVYLFCVTSESKVIEV